MSPLRRNERSPKKGIDTFYCICWRKLSKCRNERSPKKGIDIFFLFLYWWVERRSSMKNTDTLRSRLWLGVQESRKERTIGLISTVMMPSRNLFKCLTILQPNERLKNCLQVRKNIWSLLLMTGYLTQRGRVDTKRYKLAIPNLAIRDIFQTQIMEYFKESVKKRSSYIWWSKTSFSR